MSHLSPLLVQSSGICAERGEGNWLYDEDGNRWPVIRKGWLRLRSRAPNWSMRNMPPSNTPIWLN